MHGIETFICRSKYLHNTSFTIPHHPYSYTILYNVFSSMAAAIDQALKRSGVWNRRCDMTALQQYGVKVRSWQIGGMNCNRILICTTTVDCVADVDIAAKLRRAAASWATRESIQDSSVGKPEKTLQAS